MKAQIRLSFCTGDVAAILLVVLLAMGTACAFAFQNDVEGSAAVQVYQDGRLLKELALSEDAEMEISGQYSNVVEIRGGRAAIVKSDCPGEDCVHSGWINGPGRSIVCLPNRVELRIVGEGEVDFTVG